MGSVDRFKQVMSELGYELDEQEGLKLTYKKNAKYSTLVLVINLELKYVHPILVPSSIVIREKDLLIMLEEFKALREEGYAVAEKSHGALKVLD